MKHVPSYTNKIKNARVFKSDIMIGITFLEYTMHMSITICFRNQIFFFFVFVIVSLVLGKIIRKIMHFIELLVPSI